MKKILIQKTCAGVSPEVVTFETGASPDQVSTLECNTFNHHGDGYSPFFPSSLHLFYESLLLGRSLPNTMVMNHIRHYSNALAPCFFLYDLDIYSERAPELVSVVDRIERWGSVGFINIPPRIDALLYSIFSLLPDKEHEENLSEDSLGEILRVAIDTFHWYLSNNIVPNTHRSQLSEPNILEQRGSYVIAEIEDLKDIDSLYRKGIEYGLCFMGDEAVLFKKSIFIEVPMEKIASKMGDYRKLDNFLIISIKRERSFVISLCRRFFG